MKRLSKIPVSVIVMSALAIGLLAFSVIGGARAALTYESGEFDAKMQTFTIGIAVNENNTRMAGDTLSLPEKHVPGVATKEELTVSNTGTIDEYVRVTIYKYWTDDKGNKDTSLDGDLIKLGAPGSDWIEDPYLSTDERTVLYYKKVLPVGGTTDSVFLSSVMVDSKVLDEKELVWSDNNTVCKTLYKYDGKKIAIEVQADGVQTHNPVDAILSAWGRKVELDGTNIKSLLK